MGENVIVIAPTVEEACWFEQILPSGVRIEIGGVGLVECAAATQRVLQSSCCTCAPSWIILAGIAGAYPRSGVKVGECVVVSSERVSDQGAFRDGEFRSLYAKTYDCPYVGNVRSLSSVVGSSVNAAAGGFFDAGEAQIENMEGAAFFAVCSAAGARFLEVRAVSNMTTDSRAEWRFDEATLALANGLRAVIDEITA